MNYLSAEKYLFGEFELDPGSRVLKRDGQQVTITAKAIEILIELVRRRGEVVTKDQLFDNVWPGQFVEENNLTVQISALRKILGEIKGEKEFVTTISGRGYSFVAPIEIFSERAAIAISDASTIEAGGDELIGRDRELGEISELSTAGTVRLVTLTGAGGCGKTRLATEVGERSAAPSYFVDLAEVHEPGLLLTSIIEKLKIPQRDGKSAEESLTAFFRDRQVLLILDNFEQIVSAAGTLKDLLDRSPLLSVIVTSRTPLRLKAETEYKVGPLSLPSESDHDPTGSAAMRLFMIRARAVRHTFTLTAANAGDIANICRRIDGLPLAIELAAARTKVLSPASILDRLERSLELLAGGGPEMPDRQRTIRNTIAWSYNLLNDEEKALFCGLAVFAGGFTVDTAEAILGKHRQFSASILDLITSLTDWGLLTVREQGDGGVRLAMLEVVREFALELLAGSGEIAAVRSSHANYFLGLAEEAEPHLVAGDATDWMAALRSEIDNIRVAMAYLIENDGEAAARLAAAARYYWINHSQLIDGCYWLARALDVSECAPAEVRFKLIAGLGSFYRLRGDYQLSRQYYEMALAQGKANALESHVALATAGLGTVARLEGRMDDARRSFEEALSISRRIGDKRSISIALNCLADVMTSEDERQDARLYLEEAMAIYRELGQCEAECNNLNILGKIMLEDDRDEEAYKYYSRALELARSLDNKINTIDALIGFSAIACKAGNEELAATFGGAAEKLRDSIDYKLEPAEEAFHRNYLQLARARLDERVFTEAANDGRTLALAQILDLTGTKLDDLARRRETPREITIETRSTSTIIIEEE